MQDLNSSLAQVLKNDAFTKLKDDIKSTRQEIEETAPMYAKLKEIQNDLERGGQGKKASFLNEFAKDLYKVESNEKVENKIQKLRELIRKKLGENYVDEFNKSLNKSESKMNKFKEIGTSLKNLINIGAIIGFAKKTWRYAKEISQEYIDLVESQNLFGVALGRTTDQYGDIDREASKYYLNALEFQNEFNEALLTNKKEMMQYQAMYYSMFKSQGINLGDSEFMSEQLTKAGYDIASLYNLSVEDAMDKLKSGIAGQVEPLRKIGIDISESALTKVLQERGISRTVQQLSYAEKEVARYIAIIEQAGQAQGDFAKTFNNPANQIKIFKNQLAELKQVAGSFVVNVFGELIVYANAVIMALKEILKSFANLFGYDLSSYGSVALDLTEGIGDNLGGAVDNAKKLKKELFGFDEIHNIAPDTETSGAGSSGVVTGIDDKLLKDLNKWNNEMEGFRSKVHEVRDDILDFLGFERDDDGTWKLKEGYTNLEKIKDTAIVVGALFLGWKVANVLKDLKLILSTLEALKVAASIGLIIAGVYFASEGLEGIKKGEITGENLVKSLAGVLLASVGAGIGLAALGASLSVTVPVAIALALIGLEIVAETTGESWRKNEGSTFTALLNSIGFVKGEDEWYNYNLKAKLNLLAFIDWGVHQVFTEKQIFDGLKKILKNVAEEVKKIPFIGNAISSAIVNVLNSSEEYMSNSISKTTSNAINNANPFIKETAITSGKEMRKAQQSGYISLQNETIDTLKNAQTTSINAATAKARDDFFNSGKSQSKTVNAGIQSESLETGTTKLITTARTTINRSSLFTEGKNLGGTARQGYSTNNLNNETKNFVDTAKNTLNRSTLVREAQALSQTAKEPFASYNFTNSGVSIPEGISSGISSRRYMVGNAASSIANTATTDFNNNAPTYSTGWDFVGGIIKGMEDKKWDLFDVISALGRATADTIRWIWGIHSPSKVMADIAQYVPLGLAKGIDDNAYHVYDSMAKLGKGIQVNTRDLAIDTNQYIDYSTIKGQIQGQASVAVGTNIIQGISDAISDSLRNTDLKVNIEAKTEEGVIVKKVSKGINEYVMQTGELPFAIPS